MDRGVGGVAGAGLGKFMGVFFAVAGSIAAFGIGNMVQSNSAAGAVAHQTSGILGVPTSDPQIIQIRVIVGIIAAVLIGLVVIGGLKRIAVVVEKVIPALAMTSIIASIIIIISNIAGVPEAFRLIFAGAFTSEAITGGVAGVAVTTAIRFGLMRGVFSNEAGLGSGPIAYAAAKTDHPVKQGLWASFEVFLDTIIMCTLIALVILTVVPLDSIMPGWPAQPGVSPLLTGAPLVITGFANSLFGTTFGGWLMTVLIACFGFTTVIGWAFYGEKCFEYLFGLKPVMIYRVIMLPVVVFGAYGGIDMIWAIADTLNAFMVLPNIISLLILSGVVKKLKEDYFKNPDVIDYSYEKITGNHA
jgi:AGCS family alanine or glycine:cation symporter